MKVLKERVDWKKALAAINAGKYARHPHWNANSSVDGPGGPVTYQGPTMLGLSVPDPNTSGERTLVVYSDEGHALHAWSASPAEFTSKEWQVVEMAGSPKVVALAVAARRKLVQELAQVPPVATPD